MEATFPSGPADLFQGVKTVSPVDGEHAWNDRNVFRGVFFNKAAGVRSPGRANYRCRDYNRIHDVRENAKLSKQRAPSVHEYYMNHSYKNR